MTDTWGIPGPVFLWAFIGIAALIIVGAIAHRRRVLGGPSDVREDHLTPAEVAYLSEGPSRAAFASLATLHKAAVIEVEDNGRLRRTGGIPAGSSALDSAVLHAAGQQTRASLVHQEHSVATALRNIEDDLTRRGLLVSPETRKSARLGSWILLGLFVFGVFRLIAGISNDKPVGFLVVTLVALAGAIILLRVVPRVSRAGQRSLARLRHAHHYLETKNRPAWQTYDPAMTGMAVGLFGTALLWDASPNMAEAVDLRNAAQHSGTFSYGGGYGGDGGGGGGSDGGGGGGGCGGGGGGCGG